MHSNNEENNNYHNNTRVDNQKIVFLVWDREGIRASGISQHIGASLYFLSTSKIKHPVLFLRSIQILRREKPRIIICQSPPITCSIIAMLYKILFAWRSKPKIIIDAHTGAISRPGSKRLTQLVMKNATKIIVINNEQKEYLAQNYKINPIVLEDPIPDFKEILSFSKKYEAYGFQNKAIFNVAVISSFAVDEPVQEVFEAAVKMPDAYFYMTGDEKNIHRAMLSKKPVNVILTGFLDHNSYVNLLRKVDVVMDLTTDEKSLIAGGYEAVALEKPLITSNWSSLRRYFDKGTIYVDNSSGEIKNAVMLAMAKKEQLSKEMHELRIQRKKEWEEKISNLNPLFE